MIDDREEDLDPVAAEAVDALADQISISLATTLKLTAGEVFGQLEANFTRRGREIEASIQRAEDLLASIGDEMRKAANSALEEEIHRQVFPALAREAQRLEKAAELRLAKQSAEMDKLGRSLTGALDQAEGRLGVLAQGTAKELSGSLASLKKDHVASLHTATELLQAEVGHSSRLSSAALDRLDSRLETGLRRLADLLTRLDEQLTAQLDRRIQEQMELITRAGSETKAEIVKAASEQEVRLRRLGYGEVVLALLMAATGLAALLLSR